jgi:Arc/MetJ-type ribon-helix-helix transcriptional regulator
MRTASGRRRRGGSRAESKAGVGKAASPGSFSVIAGSYNAGMSKALKVMVSIPDELLERIDRAVDEQGTSRSAFLQEAARRELGWPDPGAIDAALERGRAALAGAGGFEAAELIRAEREERDARDRRR